MLSGVARRIRVAALLGLAVWAGCSGLRAEGEAEETVDQAVCRFIEAAAKDHAIPRGFLTRLIWRESSFRAHVVSHAGAQGIAQFMPGTAVARGLADPFDPEQAIPSAAAFLADLHMRFGNLGLAAAAYNGGATRVANWLEGTSNLPHETRGFVFNVTRHGVGAWAAMAAGETEAIVAADEDRPCIELAALLRGPGAPSGFDATPFAPWGVQLAGNASRARALAAFRREIARYEDLLSDIQPMIIGTRLPGRGSAPFFRVRVPAQTRDEAERLCATIRAAGGGCIVLRN